MNQRSASPGTRFTDKVLSRFVEQVSQKYGRTFGGYEALHTWSVQQPDEFWSGVWDFYDLSATRASDRVLTGEGMLDARWFEEAQINYVDQVLRHRTRAGEAIISIAEDGQRTSLSWEQVAEQVEACAAALRNLGVQKGDRVVGYLTNATEAIVSFLATSALGATWAGCAPDYGGDAAAARLSQLQPTVLVAATGYQWNGSVIDRREVVEHLCDELGVKALISVERNGLAQEPLGADLRVMTWPEVLATPHETGLRGEPVAADHPLWVLFSSGTTGVPKGIMHGHAGVITTHAELLGLQLNLDAGDRLFWYTTPNWMMWNIVVSALLVGATTVTYEGNPMHPGIGRLWDVVATERVNVFGTSPGHLQASRVAGLVPGEQFDLSELKAIAVTGAPAPVATFEWVRENVSPDVPVLSVCGGTDIVGAFLGPSPWLPVFDGELSGPVLGVDVRAYDPRGQELIDAVGEMVIRRPYPSMPVAFWNDPDGSRYRVAYYETYPGLWRQGDWVTQTSRGSFVVHGRSDSTLNRNGIRFGSADIYEIVERDPAVAEALVLGVEMPGGGYRMPMFVAAAPGAHIDDEVRDRLKQELRTKASPRHGPDEIHVVEAIPHTRTGKKLEVPLKRIMQGASVDDVLDLGAVDNPDLVEGYVQLRDEWESAGSAV